MTGAPRRGGARAFGAALLGAAALAAAAPSADAAALRYCDRAPLLDPAGQDRLLRFTAVVREALERSGARVAIVARSGLNLDRFGIRYSHAGVSLKASTNAPWTVRQLYYACDEARPRLFDQGLAGFVVGTDDPRLGFVSALLLPPAAADALERAALDNARALALLGASYSANAYAFGDVFQNCNQWLVELLALAWADSGASAASPGARADAQRWLRDQGYRPSVVEVNPLLMWAAFVVPWVHNAGHPSEDLARGTYRISLPESIEAFVRATVPGAGRIEFCHDARRVVVRRGWEAIGAGCVPGADDEVVALD